MSWNDLKTCEVYKRYGNDRHASLSLGSLLSTVPKIAMLVLWLVPAASLSLTTWVAEEPWVSDPLFTGTGFREASVHAPSAALAHTTAEKSYSTVP